MHEITNVSSHYEGLAFIKSLMAGGVRQVSQEIEFDSEQCSFSDGRRKGVYGKPATEF